MRLLGSLALAGLLAAACAGGPADDGAGKGYRASSDARAATPSVVPTGAKGGSPSPVPGVPAASAACAARPSGDPMVLIGGAIFDVRDPVHGFPMCVISNTVAHLYTGDTFGYIRPSGDTGTEVVLHAIGSNNESVVAGWPFVMTSGPFGRVGAWTVDGNAASTAVSSTDSAGNPTIQIWLFAQPSTTMLYSFPAPLTDCICRFGLPVPTLAFSADAQYLVAGWPIGKGATGLHVYRVVDRSLVAVLDATDENAFWSHTGHQLFTTSRANPPRAWTPEAGYATLDGASPWQYMPSLSPDGSEVAYTAYMNPSSFTNLRVYVYDIAAHKTRMLSDQMRSEVTFVRDGWVWYREEATCDTTQSTCGPGGTTSTRNVYAMDLATGVEQAAIFQSGQSPSDIGSGWSSAEFWPNS